MKAQRRSFNQKHVKITKKKEVKQVKHSMY